jgi:hypothetical protein
VVGRASHCCGLLLALMAMPAAAQGQTGPGGAPVSVPASALQNQETYTLHVTTREVVVEVVATGSHGLPVTDLAPNELQVFELGPHGAKQPETIAAVHFVDPAQGSAAGQEDASRYLVAPGKTCATLTAPYYLLAYRVGQEGWTSGYHEILVTASREHIRLEFRHRYFVGATAAPAKPLFKKTADATAALQQAACYHSDTPASLNLMGRVIPTGSVEGVQLSLAVQADSLAFTSLEDAPRRAQFDYGMCTFNAAGIPLRFMQATEDRVLAPAEYAQVLAHGFRKVLAFRRMGDPVFARVVVRDRALGNLGSTGVVIPPLPEELTRAGSKATGGAIGTGSAVRMRANGGPVSSFGLPIPKPAALCGDVYEIPEGIGGLPDFWKLEPIGALYTDGLQVPDQLILGTIGIPGVTTRTAWFAIDYWGVMWVKEPGVYGFALVSDDGSQVYLDNTLVVNDDGQHPALERRGFLKLAAGRHVIHIPYYQGPPRSVALMLAVKAPGGNFKPFDVRDFAEPAK